MYLVGGLTLDLARGRLFGPDGDVDLRPKSFALLSYMAQNGGRTLAKDELMAAIWPDVTVTDESLSQCIHDVRRALGPPGAALLRTLPRRGYSLAVSPQLPDRKPAEIPSGSIAVLPFAASASIPPRCAALFDGLTHDVISRLARLRYLHVIGRGTCFAMRHLSEQPSQVRKLLNVAYMVTGRVDRQGAGYQLSVDLTDTASDRLVWTDEHLLRIDDLALAAVSLADVLAAMIAQEITQAESDLAIASRVEGPSAWQELHRGIHQIYGRVDGDMLQALHHFETAIALEPVNARAYAFLSFCHFNQAFSLPQGDRKNFSAAALRSASDAMHSDDAGPVARWAYGRAQWLAGDPEAGLLHCRKAVALCPSFSHAHYMIGFIEAHHGDPAASLNALDKSEHLSPFDPFSDGIKVTRATAYARLGNMEKAADWAFQAARPPNDYDQILCPAALILAAAGRDREARAIYDRVGQTTPDYRPERLFKTLYGMSSEMGTVMRSGATRLGLDISADG